MTSRRLVSRLVSWLVSKPRNLVAFVLIDFLFAFLINKLLFVVLIIRLQHTGRPPISKRTTPPRRPSSERAFRYWKCIPTFLVARTLKLRPKFRRLNDLQTVNEARSHLNGSVCLHVCSPLVHICLLLKNYYKSFLILNRCFWLFFVLFYFSLSAQSLCSVARIWTK